MIRPSAAAAGLLAGAVVFVALAASGCTTNLSEWTQDAPRQAADDRTPALVLQMPDGYSNIATKCVGGVRYSTIYHYSSSEAGGSYGALSTVLDPACAAGAAK